MCERMFDSFPGLDFHIIHILNIDSLQMCKKNDDENLANFSEKLQMDSARTIISSKSCVFNKFNFILVKQNDFEKKKETFSENPLTSNFINLTDKSFRMRNSDVYSTYQIHNL